MKPIYSGDHERCELRTAKTERTCWTWAERGGSPEPQCTRLIATGEVYMLSVIYPGHDSGYADGGWKRNLVWQDDRYEWVRVEVPPSPQSSWFCLPCCERWLNLKRALDWINEQREAAVA